MLQAISASTRVPQANDANRPSFTARLWTSRLVRLWVASNRGRDAAIE